MTIKAINIDTKEKFNWMIREMRGLNKPDIFEQTYEELTKKQTENSQE